MFAPSLKNANDDSARYSLHQYYMALVEIKDFNVLINNKWFFLISHKKRNNNRIIKEAYEKLIKMPRNNDYITYTNSDFPNHQNYYKLTGTDLSR